MLAIGGRRRGLAKSGEGPPISRKKEHFIPQERGGKEKKNAIPSWVAQKKRGGESFTKRRGRVTSEIALGGGLLA